ncbi:MICOS complex subunit Mic10-like [Chenopodium quinoa]|uniref:MICOS complex subunit Mic10-like n=1 Tax=Chenopodium quinoa TaxID=63459 RepID=UPI000B78D5FB|nr:MICOS complex subunit Mic10-like [Chenopodium quinoa]
MAENRKEYDLDAKWDACLDLSLRRFVYSSVAGAFSGLLLFRSPVTRWASVAFGAGVGLGSAYSDCSRLFDSPTANLRSSNISDSPVSQDVQE